MSYQKLVEKYNILLKEVKRLRKENISLREKLGDTQTAFQNIITEVSNQGYSIDSKSGNNPASLAIDKKSDSKKKVKLFMPLFKGRDDIYTVKWENKKKAMSGFPLCA